MWTFYLILFLFLIYFFLVSPKLIGRNSLRGFGGFYAHRGLHDADRPENSIASFLEAASRGFGIELDVQLTKDLVPVVFHDDYLKAMCAAPGRVKDYTLAQLMSLRLAGTDEHIPTLEEVLTLVGEKVKFLIEVKTVSFNLQICESTARVLEAHKGKYIIQSFNPFILKWFRKYMPEVPRGQLISDFLFSGGIARSAASFILATLTLNFASRPDFVSIYYGHIYTYTYFIPKLFLTPFAFWTVTDKKTADRLRHKGKIIIFEGFEP
ncbi:MAG: glycerophosphodiester phosphodiesterase family protein [Eubacteriales bacterium]|nr:glycerophosphodiester phosphodiesterase family protein [Eubacteriales bacterium]